MERTGDVAAESEVDGDAARLVLDAALRAATGDAAPVHCVVGVRGDAAEVRVRGGRLASDTAGLEALAAEFGIHVDSVSDVTTISFPARGWGVGTSEQR